MPPSQPPPSVASVPSALFSLRASDVASRLCLDGPAFRNPKFEAGLDGGGASQCQSGRTASRGHARPSRTSIRHPASSIWNQHLISRHYVAMSKNNPQIAIPNSENRNPSCRAILSRHSFNDGGSVSEGRSRHRLVARMRDEPQLPRTTLANQVNIVNKKVNRVYLI
jgi:hypothetical protein